VDPSPDRPLSQAPAPKVIAVMPAYNASATLRATVADIPPGSVAEVVLVDDASRDDTVEVARALGLVVIQHPKNRGYGGNQKTCYDEALRRGADIVIMIHPDYQYDSRLVPHIVGFIRDGVCDMVLGSRVRTRRETISSGMPPWKYLSNRILTLVENIVLGLNLSELHTGYRAYSRRVLETLPYHRNSDGFVFDSQVIAQVAKFGFRIGEVPVPCRYMKEASSVGFAAGVVYGLGTLGVLARFLLHGLGLRQTLFEPAKPLPPAESPWRAKERAVGG
jgi:glycosyltransferase involved in cell wall biosynthesis